MDVNVQIARLVQYGVEKGLIEEADRTYMVNQYLRALGLDDYEEQDVAGDVIVLVDVLDALVDFAAEKGLLDGGSIVERDLFDTLLMGIMTARPSEVIREFERRLASSPEEATNWFYQFCQDVNYIRADRIKRDLRWQVPSAYGDIDITINLSKPEKDPKAIAAALGAAQVSYPACQLCAQNEGYAGRINHPARENHRIIPMTVDGEPWGFQYSPYVYFNEHCILLNTKHVPMVINRSTFAKMLDFVGQFPHYFVGSNADLPIVGGSILTHDHYQGGRFEFAMERASVEKTFALPGFDDVRAGIVHWPLSVIRLQCANPARLVDAADHILGAWRGYTDEAAFVFAQTDGVPHNTITPIARRRGELYELDLTLRNNITTDEHPLGVFHPHAQYHHIKKENIGLIEVMGLAVLPSRLKAELAHLAQVLVEGGDVAAEEDLAKHAVWAEELRARYGSFDADTVDEVLRQEVGRVFVGVLEDAGVFKCTDEGRAAFDRFISTL